MANTLPSVLTSPLLCCAQPSTVLPFPHLQHFPLHELFWEASNFTLSWDVFTGSGRSILGGCAKAAKVVVALSSLQNS